MQCSGFPLERTLSRERSVWTMLGHESNAVGCESKRLFSVLSQMYQSCMYIKCETIQRLVPVKRKHMGMGSRIPRPQAAWICEGPRFSKGGCRWYPENLDYLNAMVASNRPAGMWALSLVTWSRGPKLVCVRSRTTSSQTGLK